MLNALQINQKNYTFSTLSSSNRRNFEDSGIVLAVSVSQFHLTEYCSSALTAQAYKMVVTTVCVQIDNCFCNTWIVVHLCASLRWFRGTLFSAIYSVFFFNLNFPTKSGHYDEKNIHCTAVHGSHKDSSFLIHKIHQREDSQIDFAMGIPRLGSNENVSHNLFKRLLSSNSDLQW